MTEPSPLSDEPFQTYKKDWIRWIPFLFPTFVIAICALVLLGGRYNVTAVQMVANNFESMRSETAIGFILSAISVLLIQFSKKPKDLKYFLSKIMSVMVIGLGGWILVEVSSHRDNGWFGFWSMEPIAAMNFLLLGVALFSISPGRIKRHPSSHILAFAIGIISLLPLIAFLYGSNFSIGFGAFSEMAPNTSLCFFLMAGALSLERIDHDLAAVLLSEGPGGASARRILPVVFFVPLALGWLRVWSERRGWVSLEYGTAFFATVTISAIFIVVWIQSVALERNEIDRIKVKTEREFLNLENQIREQFVAMLSHDLRTPLTAACAYAELIIRTADSTALSKSNAQKILKSLMRCERMIRDLLDVSLIRSKQPLHLSKKDCDLSFILSDTIQELNLINGDRIVLKAEQDLKGNFDQDGIRRIIENLCNNALKYGAAESPITVQAKRFGNRICISVHNFGNPISVEQQRIIFEPFQRGNSFGRKGWGVGLTLVRGMTEAHGGRVLIKSEKEDGTTFTIELPS